MLQPFFENILDKQSYWFFCFRVQKPTGVSWILCKKFHKRKEIDTISAGLLAIWASVVLHRNVNKHFFKVLNSLFALILDILLTATLFLLGPENRLTTLL